jgi:glycosyltransferase involved in cell wall biosynthesis
MNAYQRRQSLLQRRKHIEILTDRAREPFANFPQYNYEHVIIDNHSTDRTVEIVRGIAKNDPTSK